MDPPVKTATTAAVDTAEAGLIAEWRGFIPDGARKFGDEGWQVAIERAFRDARACHKKVQAGVGTKQETLDCLSRVAAMAALAYEDVETNG